MSTAARIEELQSKFAENPRRYFAPLANEYRKAGDLSQAIALCREHLPQQPGHMSGHIVLGQALYEHGDLAEAQTVFEAALALDPENLIALRHLGDIARERGDASAARRWYGRVLDADPRNDDIAALLASLAARTTPAFTPAVAAPAEPPVAPADVPFGHASFDHLSGGHETAATDESLLSLDEPAWHTPELSVASVWGSPAAPETPPAPEASSSPGDDLLDLDTDEAQPSLLTPPVAAEVVAQTAPLADAIDAFETNDPLLSHEAMVLEVPATPASARAIESGDTDAPTSATMEASAPALETELVDIDWPDASAFSARPLTPHEVVGAVASDAAADPEDRVETTAAFVEAAIDSDAEAVAVFDDALIDSATETGVAFNDAPFDRAAESVVAFADADLDPAVEAAAEQGEAQRWEPLAEAEPSDELTAGEAPDESSREWAPAEPLTDAWSAEVPAFLEAPLDEADVSEAPSPAWDAAGDTTPAAPEAELSVVDAGFEPAAESTAASWTLDEDPPLASADEPWPPAPEEEREAVEADVVPVYTVPSWEAASVEPVAAEADGATYLDGEPGVGAEEVDEQSADQTAAPTFVTETMGELLVAQGLLDQAVSVYEQLVERRPEDVQLQGRLTELRALQETPSAPRTPVGSTPISATPVYTTPLRATPISLTPARATPIGATPALGTPMGDAAAWHTPARSATPLSAPVFVAPARRTARLWLSEVAARRVARRTPVAVPVAVGMPTPADGLASLFGTSPLPAEDVAARSLASAFGGTVPLDASRPLFDDVVAAEARDEAHGGSGPAGVVPTVSTDEPQSTLYSFDRFFPDPATTESAAPESRLTPASSGPATPTASAGEELADFSAWLKGLTNS